MYLYLIVINLLASTWCAERNTSCTTPNGERALCIPFLACDIIKDEVLLTFNDTAVKFAKDSQCGYDTEVLVCCGSSAYPIVRDTPLESIFLPNSSECGINIDDDRIYGGSITDIGEFPWMALLRYKTVDGDDAGFKCGGTLINKRYVLTAAHCIRTGSAGLILDSVRLGEWKISTKRDCDEELLINECADPALDFNIEKSISHLNYSRKSGDNDIGLIRLDQNVKFTEYIRPVCLPSFYSPLPTDGTKMVISGWGTTENGTNSDIKLKVEVPIISTNNCLAKIKFRGEVGENQICAGGEMGHDACQGDSGGPLMAPFGVIDGNAQWYQVGVIAWGIGCGKKNIPGIYTRVSQYIPWILNNMEEF